MHPMQSFNPCKMPHRTHIMYSPAKLSALHADVEAFTVLLDALRLATVASDLMGDFAGISTLKLQGTIQC